MNKEGKNGFSMSEGVIKNPLQSGPVINLSGGCGPPEPEPVLGKPVEKTLPDGSKEYNIALPKRSKDALCIIGCADSKDLAPFKEKEKYEFWGVNNLFLTQPIEQYPWTRWFEIHSITHDGRRFLRRGKPEFRGQKVNDYIEDLIKLKIPVYMQQFWPQIPNSVPYPLQAVLKAFGNYFTNTISYMLALGIAEGFKRIEVWGVDMAVDSEYFWQRPSCEYFLGIAQGRGIETFIPPEADLLKTRFLYGFQEIEDTAFRKKLNKTRASMEQRMAMAAQRRDHHMREYEQYVGAINTIKEMIKIWG